MKSKIIFSAIILALTFSGYTTQGQKTYFRLSAGYGLPMGSQLVGIESTSQSTSTYNPSTGATFYTTNSTDTGKYGSYGSGLTLNASLGTMLSEHVGLDFAINYLIGKAYTSSSSMRSIYDGTVFTDESTIKSRTRGIFFTPSVLLTAGEGKVKPYAKAGVVVGSVKLLAELDSRGSSDEHEQRALEYTGGIHFGFRGGMGIVFNPGKRVSFFSEVLFTSMTFYPKKGEVTKYTINGQDRLGTLEPWEKTMHMKKEVTTSTNSNTPYTPGSDELRESFPLGSLALNVGINIRIGKAE